MKVASHSPDYPKKSVNLSIFNLCYAGNCILVHVQAPYYVPNTSYFSATSFDQGLNYVRVGQCSDVTQIARPFLSYLAKDSAHNFA